MDRRLPLIQHWGVKHNPSEVWTWDTEPMSTSKAEWERAKAPPLPLPEGLTQPSLFGDADDHDG